MLLLGLVMAATTVGYNLYQQEQTLNTRYLFHFYLIFNLAPVTEAVFTFLCCTFPQFVPPVSRSSCGPIGKGESVFNVTGVCVGSLPSLAQNTLRYLASEAFALPLILAEM